MMRLRDRIPRDKFDGVFRPMLRDLGTRAVVLRINEAARTAIPRQSKLAQVMPKLELLVYERERPKADEELERLWNLHFDRQLGEHEERFHELSDGLNALLDQDKLPDDEQKRAQVGEQLDAIEALLQKCELSQDQIEAAFRIKAFEEVLQLYLERKAAAAQAG